MAYELTVLLNSCEKSDAEFLLTLIDSNLNFTYNSGLAKLCSLWDAGPMPLPLNHKLETEIRYLGSNDFAYMRRKLAGCVPAGVHVDEIIDDICKLMKIQIPLAETLEERLEIFAANLVDQQFSRLAPERQRALIASMGFDEYRRREVMAKINEKRERLLPIILPLLTSGAGQQIFQGLILSILTQFIGRETARRVLIQAGQRLPVLGASLGPLLLAGGAGWLIADLAGPASRKTIPLMLYLGLVSLRKRNGEMVIEAEVRQLPENDE